MKTLLLDAGWLPIGHHLGQLFVILYFDLKSRLLAKVNLISHSSIEHQKLFLPVKVHLDVFLPENKEGYTKTCSVGHAFLQS